MQPKRRRFKGHAVLDRRGSLIWGTLATKPERAQELFDRNNPDPTGEGMGEAVVPIEITLISPVR
jgi:hypothetical protein